MSDKTREEALRIALTINARDWNHWAEEYRILTGCLAPPPADVLVLLEQMKRPRRKEVA